MWVRASAPLTENVSQIVTAVSSHSLILGEHIALIDSSIGAVADTLLETLRAFIPAEQKLDTLLLTHGHFDHLGGVPFLRRAYPELEVIASPQTAELVSDRSYLERCFEWNAHAAAAAQVELSLKQEEWLNLFRVDRIVRDGDTVYLRGGVELKVIASPGHTPDSLSFFVRPDGVVVGGEALGGYHGRGKFSVCFSESYTEYLEALDKLSNLEVKAIVFSHCGALTGELAQAYLTNARTEAEKLHGVITQRLESGEVVEEITTGLYPELRDQNVLAEGPFAELVEESIRRMVQVVAEGR